MAGSYATCQAIWTESLLKELKVTIIKPLVLQLDNRPIINFARNHVLHGRSKHIEAKFHFLRQQMTQEKLEVRHCSSESQMADIFTKGLKVDNFFAIKQKLGVVLIQ